MRVLVTGASGFIGNRLCHELSDAQFSVVATGRSPSCSDLPQNCEYFSGELNSSEFLKKILINVDAIVHCAGKAGTWGPYEEFFEANVTLTKDLIEEAKRAHVKRFIHLSSPSIFFQFRDQYQLKENELSKTFINAYAKTKFLSEEVVSDAHGSEFLTMCLRPRGVIGAGDGNWLPRIIQLYDDRKLIIPGSGKNQTDFTSCKNLIELIRKCLEGPDEYYGETYNISNDEPYELWKFITKAMSALNKKRPIKRLPLGLLMAFARISEFLAKLLKKKEEPKLLPIKIGIAAFSMTLNVEKAKSVLGYRPTQSTSEALDEFVSWWQEKN
ncbi:MAG: NAD(P)-dependent oxidoreductase [Bacteriovoracaceae bacterium]|nr:NAD(P)-dependent oxidoreductase [Bacteriovoracaceae bacterium]